MVRTFAMCGFSDVLLEKELCCSLGESCLPVPRHKPIESHLLVYLLVLWHMELLIRSSIFP